MAFENQAPTYEVLPEGRSLTGIARDRSTPIAVIRRNADGRELIALFHSSFYAEAFAKQMNDEVAKALLNENGME